MERVTKGLSNKFDNIYLQDYDSIHKDRRRHSSADEMRTRLLERQALERKDSNQSTSSENSVEIQSYTSSTPRDRAHSASDVKPEVAGIKPEEEDVFSSAAR